MRVPLPAAIMTTSMGAPPCGLLGCTWFKFTHMPFLMRFLKHSAARSRPRWLPIIGTLMALLALTGCGTTRLAYNNAPTLSYWWLDAYFDFDSEQTLRVRADLQAAHAWHRKDELPLVAAELSRLKARALQNATPEQTCKLAADVQARVTAPLERLVPTIAAIAPNLSDAQLLHLEREFDKRNRSWREDYLDGTPEERIDHRLKQAAERTESLYGRLRPEQMQWLRAQMVASDYDANVQYREILRRQQDALQVLRQLRASKASPPQAQAALQALLERSLVSPDASYRQYLARILQQGCATMTELHNSMSPQQRSKLLDALQSYDDDVRALMAVR